MADHKVNIMAKDMETFKKLEDKLKLFPAELYNQIKTAEIGLAGYTFTLEPHQSHSRLYFPNISNMTIEPLRLIVYTEHGLFQWKRAEYDSEKEYHIFQIQIPIEKSEAV